MYNEPKASLKERIYTFEYILFSDLNYLPQSLYFCKTTFGHIVNYFAKFKCI